LVVDMSTSQARFYERHREDLRRFVENVLKPADRAFFTSFGDKNEIRLVDLTGSADELGRGVEALDRCSRECRSPI
jgi:hypothetical protein